MQFMANILFSEKRYSIIKLIRIVIVLMKCWQIKETIILIILSILFVIFMACLIIWRMKKYYVDERLTGDVLWILKKSPEIVIMDIPVRWKRLSGVLEITCPERGNHGFGQIMIAAEPPSWRLEPPGWGHQLAVNDYSLIAGSNPYTSLIER